MRDRHSRPEVLHGVELGDPMQVVLPGSAAVVLEEPQSPPGGGGGAGGSRVHPPARPTPPHPTLPHLHSSRLAQSPAPSGANREVGFVAPTPQGDGDSDPERLGDQ